MTVTEAEIRTALRRAVQQADLADPAGGAALEGVGVPPSPSGRRWTRVVLVAAAVVAVVAGLAVLTGGDGEQVRTDPAGVTDGPGEGTTTSTPAVAVSMTAVTIPAPADVRVLVLNGSGATGAAGELSQRLTEAGYQTLSVQNAWEPFASTVVFHREGYDRAASVLAGRIGAVQVEPVPTNRFDGIDADVIVVVGADGVVPD